MAFRKIKTDDHKRQDAWHEWIADNGTALKSIGLPPEVYLTVDHWMDFLENGHLHWHADDSTGFEFSQLSHEQMVRLCDVLENFHEFEPEYYPMIGWLHVRIGRGNST